MWEVTQQGNLWSSTIVKDAGYAVQAGTAVCASICVCGLKAKSGPLSIWVVMCFLFMMLQQSEGSNTASPADLLSTPPLCCTIRNTMMHDSHTDGLETMHKACCRSFTIRNKMVHDKSY